MLGGGGPRAEAGGAIVCGNGGKVAAGGGMPEGGPGAWRANNMSNPEPRAMSAVHRVGKKWVQLAEPRSVPSAVSQRSAHSRSWQLPAAAGRRERPDSHPPAGHHRCLPQPLEQPAADPASQIVRWSLAHSPAAPCQDTRACRGRPLKRSSGVYFLCSLKKQPTKYHPDATASYAGAWTRW